MNMKVTCIARSALLTMATLFLAAIGLSASAATPDIDYAIGPNDVLMVSVYGYPELTSEVRVSDSGKISFPLIGDVLVRNKSTRQVELAIESSLRGGNFIKQPHVLVRVEKYQSQLVSVMGCVTRPGQYPLEKSSNVIELLAAAGGINQEIAGDKLIMLRPDGSRTEYDLEALFTGTLKQNLQVHNGDTLYVPKADKFYIYGEVQKPGAYKLEPGMTVSQAIATGGGLTAKGTERDPHIKRMGRDKKIVELDAKSSDRLLPNDTLYIRESWF